MDEKNGLPSVDGDIVGCEDCDHLRYLPEKLVQCSNCYNRPSQYYCNINCDAIIREEVLLHYNLDYICPPSFCPYVGEGSFNTESFGT